MGTPRWRQVGPRPTTVVIGNSREYWVCKRKVPYLTRGAAIEAAKKSSDRTGQHIVPYSCEYCGDYHIGHAKELKCTTRT